MLNTNFKICQKTRTRPIFSFHQIPCWYESRKLDILEITSFIQQSFYNINPTSISRISASCLFNYNLMLSATMLMSILVINLSKISMIQIYSYLSHDLFIYEPNSISLYIYNYRHTLQYVYIHMYYYGAGKLVESTMMRKYGVENINKHFISANTVCDAAQVRAFVFVFVSIFVVYI